jgi:hypothetical protein
MKKIEINKLKIALRKANRLENELAGQVGEIALIIEKATGVIGSVDYLAGNGFGFTPLSNNDTHVGVDEIITWALNGEIITEELILNRKSF